MSAVQAEGRCWKGRAAGHHDVDGLREHRVKRARIGNRGPSSVLSSSPRPPGPAVCLSHETQSRARAAAWADAAAQCATAPVVHRQRPSVKRRAHHRRGRRAGSAAAPVYLILRQLRRAWCLCFAWGEQRRLSRPMGKLQGKDSVSLRQQPRHQRRSASVKLSLTLAGGSLAMRTRASSASASRTDGGTSLRDGTHTRRSGCGMRQGEARESAERECARVPPAHRPSTT